MSDLARIPFDQYQRYRLVADLCAQLRAVLAAAEMRTLGACEGQDQRLRILDVGGRTALLRLFLPDDEVVLVDLERAEVEALVLGDGAALPFRERSFDLVCAFDTLEHIPAGQRRTFLSEMARVSARYVVLAGPYDAPRVRPVLAAALDDGVRSFQALLSRLAVAELALEPAERVQLADWDTPEDVQG